MVLAIYDAKHKAFDMEKFKRRYTQPRAPEVASVSRYDAGKKTLTLNMNQIATLTLSTPEKLPVLIANRKSLISPNRLIIPLYLNDGAPPAIEKVLVLREENKSFVLRNVPRSTMPSMLHDLGAPFYFIL